MVLPSAIDTESVAMPLLSPDGSELHELNNNKLIGKTIEMITNPLFIIKFNQETVKSKTLLIYPLNSSLIHNKRKLLQAKVKAISIPEDWLPASNMNEQLCTSPPFIECAFPYSQARIIIGPFISWLKPQAPAVDQKAP